MVTEATQIIETMIGHPEACDDGVLVNKLLRHFHRGCPIENLRPLLASEHEKVVKVGIWLASELGSRAVALVDDVARLLDHPARYVRYFAMDCILTCTTRENENELAAVVSMLDDTDAAVRWGVLNFMSRATSSQLQGALAYFQRVNPGSLHAVGLRWLVGEGGRDPEEAVSFIRSDNAVLRKYGVVAAARMAKLTREPLVVACSLRDQDVSGFAEDILERETTGRDRLNSE